MLSISLTKRIAYYRPHALSQCRSPRNRSEPFIYDPRAESGNQHQIGRKETIVFGTSVVARSISLVLAFSSLPTIICGESKFAPAFEKFHRTGDRGTLFKELSQAKQAGVDIRMEIPFLLEVVSSSSDPLAKEEARMWVGLLGSQHAFEGQLFRPALAVFERQLNESPDDEKPKWEMSLVALTAELGLQPSPQALALIYRMVDNKDESNQAVGLRALARLRPLPKEARGVLLSRLEESEGKASGPEVLRILQPAIDDPDILAAFMKSAESKDLRAQDVATNALSRLYPIPTPTIEMFRRLQQRKDLDASVAASVKAAIDRIENKVPVENK